MISPEDLADARTTEGTAQYYDIFVRNAFGNYRDVLRHVSFSQRMGEMLSFIFSRGYQYYVDNDLTTAYPDENFAREVMQLFSIGLFELNMDGTRKLDPDGNPIPTYDDSDIRSFARAWTGFIPQQRRGNVEAETSRLDPMLING